MDKKQNQRFLFPIHPWRRGISDGHEITTHLALLIGFGLLLTWPVLIHGAPDFSWDGRNHAVLAKQFASQFWRGDWYPRWFTNVNAGFGGPSGFFYPPLTSYVSSLFWPFMATRDPEAWMLSGYSFVFAYVLSGITAYLWLRSLTESRAALLGAVAYMIAPYHLAYDLYYRGASAELWVFVWLPLVLLSAEGLLRHSRWAVPGGAVSYSLAILSHPSTALCFAPIAVAYLFFLSESKERVRSTAAFVVILLLGLSLDAVYLLPAILDQRKASVSLYTSGMVDYRNNWVLPGHGEITWAVHYLYDKFTGKVGPTSPVIKVYAWILMITLSALGAITLLFLLIRRYETKYRLRCVAGFYVGIALLTFFLMTKPSGFVWEIVGFLKFLQFPFRLNVMLALCLAVLAALAGPYLLRPRARAITLFLVLMAVGWLCADVWAPTRVFSAWRLDPGMEEWKQQWIRTQMEPFDMRPRPANEHIPVDASEFDRFVAIHPPKTARLAALSTGNTSGTARVERWQPRRVVLKVEATRDSELTLNHFYYAGWQGRIEGAATNLTVSPSPDGFIQIDVPKGDYDLILELPKDSAERSGAVISLVSLSLLGGVVIWGCLRRNRTDRATVTA